MINYAFLRPRKKEDLKKWHGDGFLRKENLEYVCCENATILPVLKKQNDNLLFGRGGVVDANGNYVEMSSIEKRMCGEYEYSDVCTKNLTVVYCGYWAKQWGHFLTESVARLWYFLRNDETIDKYVFTSELGGVTELYGNYREFFELLGVDKKIEIINTPVRYRKVIIPELAYSRTQYYHCEYKEIFDKIALNAKKQYNIEFDLPKRIFLSRSQFAKAKLEEEGLHFLDHYFKKNGYTILYPEKLSLTELIVNMSHADICAAESGTLPHNLLFAQKGKKVIVVERQATINEIQANLDVICDLNATYVDGYYALYPVAAGGGPYLMAYTAEFVKFTEENGYLPPDESYMSECYYKKMLSAYMKKYKKAYGYGSGMEEWQLMYADTIYEAYTASLVVFGQYLNLTKPFRKRQMIELHFLKLFVKRMLKK